MIRHINEVLRGMVAANSNKEENSKENFLRYVYGSEEFWEDEVINGIERRRGKEKIKKEKIKKEKKGGRK